MALNATPGSPIIPLNAPVLQGQGYGGTTTTPTPATTTPTVPLSAKPQSTLPLPVILPLTVSIPPSAPLTPPARGRSRRGQRQRANRAKAAVEPASSPVGSSSIVRSTRPPAIPSIAVSSVAAPAAPVKPLAPHEVQQVEAMIERCLHLYMNQEEVIMALQIQANIAPAITRHVWQSMEGKSAEFFRAYEVRLKIKEQIMAFNYLVSQQAQVTEKSKNMALDSGSFSTSTTSSMAQSLAFPFAPFNPLGGLSGYEPLPSPFAAPAPVGILPLTSSLSSLLTTVQPPSGMLTSSTESALTLSTNSLINSFLKTSSDSVPSSSASATSSASPSSTTSLSFAFGPPPSQLSASSSSSTSISSSSLLSAMPTNNGTGVPLLSSGSFAMPFISVENMDSPTTPFSPFALFSTQPIITTSTLGSSVHSEGGLFGSASATSAASTSEIGSAGSHPMPIPNQSLLGEQLRNSTAGVSPLSTSPTPESFLTSSICSIPLTASTNALLDALSAGGTSPLRFSPLLTASTSSAPLPPFNGSLEGLFPDLGSNNGGGGGGGGNGDGGASDAQQRRADQ